jgi:cytoskeletal protein CcmA (bactofilin family)
VPVFKRRKPDDPHAAEPGSALPAGLSFPDRRDDEDHPGAPSGPTDNGLGVPPFRPAQPQEVQTMSRQPFTTAPAPAPQAVPPVGVRPGLPPIRAASRDPAERRTLVVGRGISVQGTVQDAERLVVEGTVEASMIHATELAISPGGVFKGEIEVEDAEIAGTIDGTLTARGALVVRATGKVLGTARCRRLQVEDGGQITGHIEMLVDQAKPDPTPRPVSEPIA